jgi:DNA-binding GntR family transcriptional regulator
MATMTDELRRNGTADKERSEVERVYHLIRDWMIASELAPGAFLSEPEIAERCGTSRTPVREALSRLVQDGWVESIHRKGFQVRPVTLRDISELFTYRRLFERYAGERAAATATIEHIAELESIVELEERPNIPMKELTVLNERFHLALAYRTENQRIIGQMRLIMAYTLRLNPLFMTFVDSVSHRQILESVKSRDGVLAGSLMAEHVEFALTMMIKSFCK